MNPRRPRPQHGAVRYPNRWRQREARASLLLGFAALALACSKPPAASEKPLGAPPSTKPGDTNPNQGPTAPAGPTATPMPDDTASADASDKFALAEKAATSDLASVAAAAHVPGQWRTFLFWDQARKATMAEARLVFAADPTDPLADAPYLTADLFQVEIGPPARIVSHADPKKLEKAAKQTAAIEPALSIARAELKTLDRYRGWQREKWRYEARVSVSAANGHVTVTFDPPRVTDNDVRIVVDPIAKSVVQREVHME